MLFYKFLTYLMSQYDRFTMETSHFTLSSLFSGLNERILILSTPTNSYKRIVLPNTPKVFPGKEFCGSFTFQQLVQLFPASSLPPPCDIFIKTLSDCHIGHVLFYNAFHFENKSLNDITLIIGESNLDLMTML